MPSLMHARAGAPRELRDEALDLMLGALSVDDAEPVDAAPNELQKIRNHHEDAANRDTLAHDPALRTPCAPNAGALARLDIYTLAAVACDDALAHHDVLSAVSALSGEPQDPMTLQWLTSHPGSWHGALWAVYNLDEGLDEREDWVLDTDPSTGSLRWCCKRIEQVENENVDVRLSRFCSILYGTWWQLRASNYSGPLQQVMTDVLNRAASTIAYLPAATQTMIRDDMRREVENFPAANAQSIPDGALKQLVQ